MEELELKIKETIKSIDEKNKELLNLKLLLEETKRRQWSPPTGVYVVGKNGKILKIEDEKWVDIEFGNVRQSEMRAEKLAENQRKFNRISAFFGDCTPTVNIWDTDDYSAVSLTWFDYSKPNLLNFKESVIQC